MSRPTLRLRSVRFLFLALPVALCLEGCPAATKGGDPPATCVKAGETCTFAPGKLGVCVAPEEPGRGLVCQSLH